MSQWKASVLILLALITSSRTYPRFIREPVVNNLIEGLWKHKDLTEIKDGFDELEDENVGSDEAKGYMRKVEKRYEMRPQNFALRYAYRRTRKVVEGITNKKWLSEFSMMIDEMDEEAEEDEEIAKIAGGGNGKAKTEQIRKLKISNIGSWLKQVVNVTSSQSKKTVISFLVFVLI